MLTSCFFVTPFNYSAGYPANSVSGATISHYICMTFQYLNNFTHKIGRIVDSHHDYNLRMQNKYVMYSYDMLVIIWIKEKKSRLGQVYSGLIAYNYTYISCEFLPCIILPKLNQFFELLLVNVSVIVSVHLGQKAGQLLTETNQFFILRIQTRYNHIGSLAKSKLVACKPIWTLQCTLVNYFEFPYTFW